MLFFPETNGNYGKHGWFSIALQNGHGMYDGIIYVAFFVCKLYV